MPAIRPAPRDTSFETPAMAETQTGDYVGDLVYDSLYHSPVWSTYRWSELKQEQHDSNSIMQPADANKIYGLNGELNFTDPVPESYAQLLHDRKIAEYRREYEMASGTQSGWGRKISGLGVSLVSQVIDPVNLAAMFVPVVGPSRYLSGAKEAAPLLRRGLISPKTLSLLTSGSRLGYRLASGALSGAAGAAIIEPFNLAASLSEQAHYDLKDSAVNIAFSSVMGAGLHGFGGFLSDKFKAIRGGMRSIDPQTHEASMLGAVNDLVQDKPISSPADIVSVDDNVIGSEQQEVNTQNMFTIAQEHLDRLEQMPNKTPQQEVRQKLLSAMLNNPTSATPENLARMFELKLNEDKTQMPQAYQFIGEKHSSLEPVKFDANKIDSKIEQIDRASEEMHQHLAELQGLGQEDIENGLLDDSSLPGNNLNREEFIQIAKFLASKGYDILNPDVQVKSGAESLVFLLKDKVVKLFAGKGERIPGISLTKDLEHTIGKWNIQITDRIHPLNSFPEHINAALQMLGKAYGIDFQDLHGGNLGYDSSGNLRIIDDGGVSGFNEKANPNPKQASFLWNIIPQGEKAKANKEQSIIVYQQLLKQIEETKKAKQDSLEQRVQEIVQRRQSEQSSPQKSLDLTNNLDKSDGTEPIKKEPEPILTKPTEEEVSKEQSDLEKEMAGLEKEFIADPENKEKLDAMNEDLAKLKKVDKAVQAGAVCITQKAV